MRNGSPVCSNGTQSPNAEQRNRKDTYATQWGLSVQQALPSNFLGTLSYVGSKGTHLLQESYVNVENPLTGLRPYPAFSQIPWRGTIGNSSYNALAVSLKRLSLAVCWSRPITHGPTASTTVPTEAATATPLLHRMFPASLGSARNAGERPAAPSTPATCSMRISSMSFLLARASRTFRRRVSQGRVQLLADQQIFIARTGFPVNLTTSATGPDGNTNESASQPGSRPALVFGRREFQPRGFLHSRDAGPALPRWHLPRQDSAMSPAISCEVPGSGNLIWRFPSAFRSRNGCNFSSGPRCSTSSTGRCMPIRMA